MRYHFPLTARALHVENAVQNFSEINGDWMSESFGLGQQWFENFPLGIAQVALGKLFVGGWRFQVDESWNRVL